MTTLLAATNVEGAVSAGITFGPNAATITGALIAGATTLNLSTNVGNAVAPGGAGSWVLIQDTSGLTELCKVASVQGGGGEIILAAPGCVNAHGSGMTVCQVTITSASQQAAVARSPYLSGG